MLNKLKTSKSERTGQGFTIIEVMIVLAIAALILLIVLLAVPALQRSSRNTQRKNDVSAIAASVANYISNNNGVLPTSAAPDPDGVSVDICQGPSTTSCPATVNIEPAKLGYYAPSSVTFIGGTANPTAPTTEAVEIDPGYGCPTSGITNLPPSPRSAAIIYTLEPNSKECTEQ